ncbi:MAG TPA: zf-HC2 domain-containing protein [Candidatus Polarisedimenticolia bacterium]|jgi:hypothetical protein
MTHEEYQSAVPAYLAGRLAEEERRRLESHLSVCEDCEELVTSLHVVPEAVARHGASLFDPHPDPSDLRRFVGDEPVEDRERVRKHLAVCVSCELEAAGWSAPVLHAAGRVEGSDRWGPVKAGRLAAAVSLLAAGLVLGFLLASLAPGRSSSGDGPIDLPVLDRATRGGSAVTRIHVRAGQSAFVIAVPFVAPEGRSGTEPLRLDILSSDGRPIFTLRDTAAGLRRRADASGVIALLIDRRRLAPGAYQVAISGAGGPEDRIAVMPFEVVGEEPRTGTDGTEANPATSPND